MALSRGPQRDSAITATVARWAATDPQAALAWASQITESRLRSDAVSNAINIWATTDAQAAANYALALGR